MRELGSWRHGHSTEDMEMALRIQEAGYLIANAPNAIVHTATPTTLRDLFHQRVRWTYGWLRNAIDYRHMIGNTRYGNLGLVILPSALISIATGIYFFTRFLWYTLQEIIQQITRIGATGVLAPHYTLDPFTSTPVLLVSDVDECRNDHHPYLCRIIYRYKLPSPAYCDAALPSFL